MTASLSVIARRLSFIRETDGENAGSWVDFVQRFTGNVEGDSWCSSFVSLLEDIATKGHPPTKRTASCADKLADARAKGFVVQAPQPDDVFFYVDATGHAHHTGIVTATSPLTGIAGNTSSDGASSNGDGVYEHPLTVSPSRIIFVRFP
jgi:hypothetical protein